MKLTPELVEFAAECVIYNYTPTDDNVTKEEYVKRINDFIVRTEKLYDPSEIKQCVHDVFGKDDWFKKVRRELLTAIIKAEQCKGRKELETAVKNRKRGRQSIR